MIESLEFNGACSLVCDSCGKGIDFESFKKAVAFKKAEKGDPDGWRSYKVGDEWKDSCPDCCEEYKNSLRESF